MSGILKLCQAVSRLSFQHTHQTSSLIGNRSTSILPSNPSQLLKTPVLGASVCAEQIRSKKTLEYMLKHKPKKKKKVTVPPLEGNPFRKGIVLKTLIKKPKKPNSANRKCVRVRLTNGREITAYIPGIGHNLQEHHIVLIRGGRVQDLPGVKHKCVRGKYDLSHIKKGV